MFQISPEYKVHFRSCSLSLPLPWKKNIPIGIFFFNMANLDHHSSMVHYSVSYYCDDPNLPWLQSAFPFVAHYARPLKKKSSQCTILLWCSKCALITKCIPVRVVSHYTLSSVPCCCDVPKFPIITKCISVRSVSHYRALWKKWAERVLIRRGFLLYFQARKSPEHVRAMQDWNNDNKYTNKQI